MSSTLGIDRPPAPPEPPRTGSRVVAIALLILALIVLVSGLAVWIGLRYIARNVQVRVEEGSGGKKEVSIKTPVASLEVTKGVSEARLGLPIYPGAKRLEGDEGATLNFEFGREKNLGVLAVKFETSDSVEKVRDFYRERLGSEPKKPAEKAHGNEIVFELKAEHDEKIVALKSRGAGTEIALVRVTHAEDSTN